MKKLFLFFAAMLVAVAVNAQTDFSTPYYCAADDAAITGDAPSNKVYLNSTVDPHQIEWSDVSKTYTSVIKWEVEATRGCYVSVSLGLGTAVSSNKHIFQIKIIDAKGNERGYVEEAVAYSMDGYTDKETVKALDGTILLPAAGTYTVELRNNRDYCKGSIRNVILTYAADAPSEIVEVSAVELNKTELALDIQEVEQLIATVSPDNATDPSVTWTSSDEAVATVSDGFVTAVAAGTATITAKAGEKSATCAITVAAAPVPEVKLTSTYTLAAKVAHLEGKIWKQYDEEKYKLYGDGGHNAQYGNALWTINVTNPCIISGTITGIGGGSLYELDVFKGEDSITTIIQPVASKWWSGNVDMEGTITLAEAGVYTFRLRNTLEWSSGKTTGVMLSYEADAKTLYCYVDKAWWTGGEAKVNCYAKVQDGPDNTWPGVAMTEVEANLWKVVIPGTYNKINFVRTNPDQDTYWGAKTDEMDIPTNKNLFTITSDDAQWDSEGHTAQGTWSVYGAKFLIAGSMTNWDKDPIASLEDSYVLHLEAGKHQLKVVDNGNWLGIDKMSAVAAGLYIDQDKNVCFILDAAGDVTVNFKTDEVFTLAGDFAIPEVKLIGIDGWEAATDAIELEAAGDGKSASKVLNLTGSWYDFKVIRADEFLGKENEDGNYTIKSDWNWVDGLKRDYEGLKSISLLPDGSGDYTFTWTFATGKLEVTYPEKGGATAISNTETEVKAQKVIENGQIFILKNGVKYNVLGASVK